MLSANADKETKIKIQQMSPSSCHKGEHHNIYKTLSQGCIIQIHVYLIEGGQIKLRDWLTIFKKVLFEYFSQ